MLTRCLAAGILAAIALTGCGGRRARNESRDRAVQESRPAERRDDRRDAKREALTGWEKLGERTVSGRGDVDVIRVGARDGTFKRIRLSVEHSALTLSDVVVTFGNGETFSPKTKLVFAKNTNSRVIDLPGKARIISKVAFRYGNLPGGGRAQIELWAK